MPLYALFKVGRATGIPVAKMGLVRLTGEHETFLKSVVDSGFSLKIDDKKKFELSKPLIVLGILKRVGKKAAALEAWRKHLLDWHNGMASKVLGKADKELLQKLAGAGSLEEQDVDGKTLGKLLGLKIVCQPKPSAAITVRKAWAPVLEELGITEPTGKEVAERF